MTSLLIKNIEIIYLFYGLVFFLLGFAINIHPIKQSKFALADKLWILAVFAYLHGLGEWAVIFIPSQTEVLSPVTINILKILPPFLWATSFSALLFFGIELCISGRVISKYMRLLPIVVFSMWFASFIISLIKGNIFYKGSQDWLVCIDILARYFMGAPGALFSAWGLYLLKKEVSDLDSVKVPNYLNLAVTAFIFYAIVAGMVVQQEVFFPASIINVQNFIAWTGIPIELLRSLSGFLITLSLIKGLEIFELESQRRMKLVQKQQALLAERGRISRDLHDGVIQSLYAVGLSLQSIKTMNHQNSSLAKELDGVLGRLDEVVKDIRKYVQGLVVEQEQVTSFSRRIREMARPIERCQPLKISFAGAWDRPLILTRVQEENLYLIAKEALSNVVRHAQTDEVILTLSTRGGVLEMSVKDYGKGFDIAEIQTQSCSGLGLKNMIARAREMGGEVKIKSADGKGTEIKVELPWKE